LGALLVTLQFLFFYELHQWLVLNGLMEFHYVYRLISENHLDRYYTGLTSHLKARLAKHNRNCNQTTTKSRTEI